MAFFFSVKYPQAKWVLIPIALTVGYSRIYVGVHYPFDVLGGFALGVLVAWSVLEAEKKILKIINNRKKKTDPTPEAADIPIRPGSSNHEEKNQQDNG